MPLVKVNDINMYYEIHGDGFPLVMIIGLGSPLVFWDEVFIEKISKKFKVILFDNRGAGRTDKPKIKYSIQMFADDTAGLMDKLEIERAHVLGISMGGMIAQEVALNYPEKVEKLVLCATNCGWTSTFKILARLLLPIFKISFKRKMKTPESTMQYVFSGLYTEEYIKENHDVLEERKKKLIEYVSPFEVYERQTRAILKFNTRKRLKNLEIPTLILHGKKDSLVAYKRGLELAKLIPYSRLASFDNSGHGIFTMERDIVIKAILEFLE